MVSREEIEKLAKACNILKQLMERMRVNGAPSMCLRGDELSLSIMLEPEELTKEIERRMRGSLPNSILGFEINIFARDPNSIDITVNPEEDMGVILEGVKKALRSLVDKRKDS